MNQWTVIFSSKAKKQLAKLPENVQAATYHLVREIEVSGPVRGNWKNYSKLQKAKHHCHIKSGKPTYVVCWEVIDKKVRIVEVYYVGSHEKVPY